MSRFKFIDKSSECFYLNCIAAPTPMEEYVGDGEVFCHFFAVAEDDNSSIMSDNHMLDAIYQYGEVEYEGVMYRIEDSMYPANTSYYDHINKDIKCMILLSLTEIE